MKRLLLIFFSLCLFVSLEGQSIIRANPFARAQVVAESGGAPAFLTSDGYTEGWYIAKSENITIDVGVTTWEDETANNNDLIQETDAREPAFASDIVSFDGSDDMITDVSFVYAQPLVIYAVMRQVTYTNNDVVFYLAIDAGIYQVKQYDPRRNGLQAGGSFYWTDENTMPANNTWAIYRFVINGASSSIRVNGGSAITGSVGAESTEFFQIGSASVCPQMDFREIIVRSIVDDAGDDADIMDYLNTTYSIY